MKRYTIGYFGAYIADAYGTAIVEAVADVVHHCGGQLVMIADSAMLQEKDEFLKHGFAKEGVLSGLDGLIVNVRRREKSIMNQHGVGWLANFYKGPVVTIDCSWGDFPQVSHDQEQATRAAIAHMREHHGVERMGAISVYKNDLALVKDVMKSEGVLARPEHAVLCENEAGLDDAVACFRKTRSGLSVSVVIAPESISARGLVVSFQKAGVLIPQDLALICSDAPYCPEQGTPGITTTGPSYSRIAREAAEAMMLHVQQGTPLKSTRVQGRLMVRRKVHVFMEHAEGKRKSEAMPEWMSPARERTAQRIVTRRAMWGLQTVLLTKSRGKKREHIAGLLRACWRQLGDSGRWNPPSKHFHDQWMAERSQRTYAKVTSGISWDAFWSALLEEMRLGHMRRMYVCVHRKIDPPWMASHILFAAEDDREIVPPDDPSWRFDLSKGLFPPDIFHGESVAPVSFLRFYELLASLSSFSAVT